MSHAYPCKWSYLHPYLQIQSHTLTIAITFIFLEKLAMCEGTLAMVGEAKGSMFWTRRAVIARKSGTVGD